MEIRLTGFNCEREGASNLQAGVLVLSSGSTAKWLLWPGPLVYVEVISELVWPFGPSGWYHEITCNL